MPERIKLTEENWDDFEQLIAGKYNTMGRDFTTNDEQKLEQLKQQILKDHEKIPNLEEEIKQLKEDLELYHTHDDELLKLISTHTLISIKELSNLKQKLDEIKKWNDSKNRSFSSLKKILEEKSN